MQTSTSETPCCCPQGGVHPEPAGSTVAAAQDAFGAFLRAARAGGAIDEKTKELLLFSLVVFSRCAPCFDAHYHQAREIGITQPELDEAAWCAIVMGGAPVRMFYQENLKRIQAPR